MIDFDAARLTQPLTCPRCTFVGVPTIRFGQWKYLGNAKSIPDRIELHCIQCDAEVWMRPANVPKPEPYNPQPWTRMEKAKLWFGIITFWGVIGGIIWVTS